MFFLFVLIPFSSSFSHLSCRPITFTDNFNNNTFIFPDITINVNQNSYNIFNRTIENNGLKQTARECGKGIISFSPLAQGMLTDRYLHGIPSDSRVVTDGRFLHKEQLNEKRIHTIQQLNDLAVERGESLAQMALKWVLKDSDVTSVLIGASKPEQILENLKVMEAAPFTEEELKKIDEISLS